MGIAGERGDSDHIREGKGMAGGLGFWSGFSFPKIEDVGAIANAAERQDTAVLSASRIRYPLKVTVEEILQELGEV